MPKTLYDKIWDSHVIVPETDAPAILFIDLHLIHEVTSPQAFDELKKRGLRVRRTDLTLGTADHSIPTTTRVLSPTEDREAYDIAWVADTSSSIDTIKLSPFSPDSLRFFPRLIKSFVNPPNVLKKTASTENNCH